MEKGINIVVTCDDKYIQHLSAMLVSVFENTKVANHINIFFLNHGIKENSKKDLGSLCDKYRAEIEFVDINKNIFEGFYVSNHINKVAYYRILAPLLLPEKVGKYIYLDIDIILNEDIQLLFNTSLANNIIAAVFDPYGEERYEDLDILDEGYFNSGVLVVDKVKWLEQGITDKVLNFIREQPKLKYHDQDALNYVLKNHWLRLDNEWNVQTSFFEIDNQYGIAPKIIHYTSHRKPWNLLCYHPFKNMYYKYLGLTKWAAYKPIPVETQKVLSSDEKVVIFGTGSIAEEFQHYLNKGQVKYFLDNDKEKQGSLFKGLIVKHPAEMNLNNEIIIICSSYFKEIKNQLESYGLIMNQDFYLGYI